jgi:hypothetical protein
MPPERLALDLRPQVPDGIHDRGGSEVDDALLRSEPAQLTVAHDPAPEAAHVGGNRLKRRSLDNGREGARDGDAGLGAAADGEGEPVPLDAVGAVRA